MPGSLGKRRQGAYKAAPCAASEVDHRPRGAGGGDGRLCLPAPAAHLPSADIMEAILDGRQPKGLRLAELLGNGPLAWEKQWMRWGTRFAHGEVDGRLMTAAQ